MVRRHSTARKQEVRNRKTKGSRMVALAEEDASSLLLAPAVGRERNANIEEGGKKHQGNKCEKFAYVSRMFQLQLAKGEIK